MTSDQSADCQHRIFAFSFVSASCLKIGASMSVVETKSHLFVFPNAPAPSRLSIEWLPSYPSIPKPTMNEAYALSFYMLLSMVWNRSSKESWRERWIGSCIENIAMSMVEPKYGL